jgi:carbamoyl-phosphate synthase small subunit
LLPVQPPALLALADGNVFIGHSIGAPGSTVGEVVFNTALTGYQEILTDPSYCRQIVTSATMASTTRMSNPPGCMQPVW